MLCVEHLWTGLHWFNKCITDKSLWAYVSYVHQIAIYVFNKNTVKILTYCKILLQFKITVFYFNTL